MAGNGVRRYCMLMIVLAISIISFFTLAKQPVGIDSSYWEGGPFSIHGADNVSCSDVDGYFNRILSTTKHGDAADEVYSLDQDTLLRNIPISSQSNMPTKFSRYTPVYRNCQH